MQSPGVMTLMRDSFDPTRTLVVVDGLTVGSLPWQMCDEIARIFRKAGEAGREHEAAGNVVVSDIHALSAGPFTLERDPDELARARMIVGGRLIGRVPWAGCLEISTSFIRAARGGEEYEKANLIIPQESALIRTGAPFAMSMNPKIRDAAYTDAQWDSKARRTMPMRGVPSPRRCGTPTIKHSKE